MISRRTQGILKWGAFGAALLTLIVIALSFVVGSATGAVGAPVSSVTERSPEPPPNPRALPAAPLPEGVHRIDDLLEPIRLEHERPALAAAVTRSSGLIALGAVGLRNAAADDRVTAHDHFGESWEELMRARLFEPLGMTSAGFGPPGNVKTVAEPWGHRRVFGRYVPVRPGPGADNPAVIGPAGTVHASLADWAKFAALHLRGARGDAELLRTETFRKLHDDPYQQEYAMGWVVAERGWAGGKVLTHGGSNGMWMAVVWIAPERDLAFLAATNSGDAGAYPAVDAAVAKLVETFR